MVNYDPDNVFSVTSFPTSYHHQNVKNIHVSEINSNSSSSSSSSTSQIPHTSYLLVPSTSVLTIKKVHLKHAGNYTCAPSKARSSSITVHVLIGMYIIRINIFKVLI